MRLLKINLLSLGLVLLSVSVASAITLRLENTSDPFQVAVYLDMEGSTTNGAPTRVNAINIGVDSTDATITYIDAEPAPTLPQVGDAEGILLSFSPFGFLAPTPAYGAESISQSVPPGKTRALVDFFSAVATDGSASGTENVLMGTLNYDVPVDGSDFDLQFGTDGGFFVQDNGIAVSIDDQINLVNNVPEPGTAAMGLAALASLGLLGRASRQR